MSTISSERESKAAEFVNKADSGDADAQYELAEYLLFEEDHTPRKDITPDEVARAMDYLRLAAAQGYHFGWAAAQLGDLYYDGELVPQDFEKARLWYNTALLKENPGAAYKLGEYSYYGIGCPIDHEKAVKFYVQSLSPCYIDAFISLASMYMKGEYFSQDKKFARVLFEFVRDVYKDWKDRSGLKSPLYDKALNCLDELEHVTVKQGGADEDAEVQRAAREQLFEVMDEYDI
jgi:TPR repeat protein